MQTYAPRVGAASQDYDDHARLPPMTVLLRNAAIGDAEAITIVHKLSREAYYGERLEQADANLDRLPMWRRKVCDPLCSTVVAEEAGTIVGFVSARVPAPAASSIELSSLYVLPTHFGLGIGSDLYERFILLSDGLPAHLEVWEGNDRAVTFYRRRAWQRTSRIRPGIAGLPFVTWELAPGSPGPRRAPRPTSPGH
jgi:ribosomal protein S18 acetylase RimI-like enzyme